MTSTSSRAHLVVERCRKIAAFSDDKDAITRTFLSPAMRDCLDYFVQWATSIGLNEVRVDNAGNFRASLKGSSDRRLIIGSHLDSVPQAGAFDGILGVVLGMTLAESLARDQPACSIEVVGFSEEEGVRFGRPFIGSMALLEGLAGDFLSTKDKNGISVRQAIADFGLETARLDEPQMNDAAAGYLEFHIEQGPVLESLDMPLGVVRAIVGQTRAKIEFVGRANHAGTTPMNLRQDAFCGAAEWALLVERKARQSAGLVATVGNVQVLPGATNVVPGHVSLSLDLRHAEDAIRLNILDELMLEARRIADRRQLEFKFKLLLNQKAVPMDEAMVTLAERSVTSVGVKPVRMTSGAGHDAMILARRIPSAMIFLRSPGGISHHPDETVIERDVELALTAGRFFVENFA